MDMWSFICAKNSRNFFRFWFAQLIAQFGDRVYQMALVGLMTALHPGSVMAMSTLFAFAIVPAFIIGPVAGVYVDRWDRRTVLVVTYALQGALVLWAAFYLIRLPFIWPMYAVVFLISSLGRFYIPAKMSFLPEIVHKDDLHVANALSTITGMIAGGLGVLLGSWIVERTGFFAGFCWDTACYLIAALLVFCIHRAASVPQEPKGLRYEILEGIRYIRLRPEIRFIFWMLFVLLSAVGAVYVVIIVFIQQAFHSVTADLGFLSVSLTVGLFLGSLAYGRWGRHIAASKVIFWSLIAGGILVILFALLVQATHDRGVALVLSFILGFAAGPVTVAPNTVINQICAKEMSGKVFAAMEFVIYLAFLLAMMASSFLSEFIDRLWILIGVGGIFMSVGLAGLLKFKP